MGLKGEDIVKKVFGGSLYQQGRGFYVSLELLAILRGSLLLELCENESKLLPESGDTELLRPTHDFARRLMSDWYEQTDRREARAKRVSDKDVGSLRSLLLGLHAPVPGRRNDPADWRKWHLYPYPAEFIHYDALVRITKRAGKEVSWRISVERDSYRGGGGLAHRILREDADKKRLQQTRDGFRHLLGDAEGPLNQLGRALQKLDEAQPEHAWKDETEAKSVVLETPWVEQLQDGVHRLATRTDVPDSKRIEALLRWVPYCIARHQQTLAHCVQAEGKGADAIIPTVFDCQPANSPVRDRARDHLRRSSNAIYKALEYAARQEGAGELLDGSQNWRTGPRTFFATTCFAVGALNANVGVRWFTVTPEMAEAIVLAKVDGQVPLRQVRFELLGRELGMIIGMDAARDNEIHDIDNSMFEDNAKGLAAMLGDLGLLERYSDATELVGVRS